MENIATLITAEPDRLGWLDPAAYERTVEVLLSGESDPVITSPPQGAWTHGVWEQAMGQ